jgi:predicted DNA-binding transcriptional regulator
MSRKEKEEPLKGKTLAVYLYLLKNNKPVGAREIQRKLDFSTPSLAIYHLSKLEELGLVKKEGGGFIVNKVVTDNNIKVKHFLVPRFLFYSVFSSLACVFELNFRPAEITSAYFFFLTSTLICTLIFCFETTRTWKKGSL